MEPTAIDAQHFMPIMSPDSDMLSMTKPARRNVIRTGVAETGCIGNIVPMDHESIDGIGLYLGAVKAQSPVDIGQPTYWAAFLLCRPC